MQVMKSRLLASAIIVLLAGTSSAASAARASDCAALDQVMRDARTDFQALKRKDFEAARCSLRNREFKCAWSFPADTYAAAETQAARLARCTASQPGISQLAASRDEALFQLNPETTVAILGPELDSGSWTIRLRITTTADWD